MFYLQLLQSRRPQPAPDYNQPKEAAKRHALPALNMHNRIQQEYFLQRRWFL